MRCCEHPRPYKIAYYTIRRRLFIDSDGDIIDHEITEEHHDETLPEIMCDNCGAELGEDEEVLCES